MATKENRELVAALAPGATHRPYWWGFSQVCRALYQADAAGQPVTAVGVEVAGGSALDEEATYGTMAALADAAEDRWPQRVLGALGTVSEDGTLTLAVLLAVPQGEAGGWPETPQRFRDLYEELVAERDREPEWER